MIRITIFKDSESVIHGFDCTGHAGYAPAGEDIICAGVSALVFNAINSIEALTDVHFTCDAEEETGNIKFRLTSEPTKDSNLLLCSMVIGLQGILENYGEKYITLNFREV